MKHRVTIAITAVLLMTGGVVYWMQDAITRHAPPVPVRVVSDRGSIAISGSDIRAGETVWHELVARQSGSLPRLDMSDWTANWLHIECLYILDKWSYQLFQNRFAEIPGDWQDKLRTKLARLMHENRYNAATQTLTLESDQAEAFQEIAKHYLTRFAEGDSTLGLAPGQLTDAHKIEQLAQFYFWRAWAAATKCPNTNSSYTNDWPRESLMGDPIAKPNLISELLP